MRQLRTSFDLMADAEMVVGRVWSSLESHPSREAVAAEVAIGLLARAVPGLTARDKVWAIGEVARLLTKKADE